MTSGNPGSIIFVVVLMLGALYAVVSVMLTDGNAIGQMCMFLMIGGFILSLMSPKRGFYTWIVFCGYNDLLKRLLVVGGRITHEDLKFVLGITPMMFGGVVASLVLAGFLGSRRISGREWALFLGGLLLMLLAGVSAMTQRSGGMDGVLQGVANNGLYSMLLFVVPVLFRSKTDFIGLWRCLVIAYLPVAIYGVYQQINGFADFEIDYLRSGLTIEIKQLFMGEVRAFSTLNSPTALSVVCAVLEVSSLLLGFLYRGDGGRTALPKTVALMCFLLHTAGLIASTGRSAILILPTALLGTWCFASHGRTRFFYTAVTVSFLALVASSRWIIEHLSAINEQAIGLGAPGGFNSRMLVVGTYWDRLAGFSEVLMNPKAWSLLGYGKAEDGSGMYYYHDPISEILMRFGAIALFAALIALVLMLRWFHKQAWRIESASDRQFASAMIALGFSMLLVSALSGTVVTVFPVNILFWLSCAGVIGLSKPQAAVAPKASPAVPLRFRPRAVRYRPKRPAIHPQAP